MLNQLKIDVPKFLNKVTLPVIRGHTYYGSPESLFTEKSTERTTGMSDKDEIINIKEKDRIQNERLKYMEEKETEIDSLKDTIETLKIELEGFKTKEKCLPAHQAAILVVALCRELKQMPANGREFLFPLLQLLWGFTESTSKQALRKKITQKQADKVADKLDELIITPKISRLIRSLPEILEKENRERLQNLNKAH